MAWSIVAFLSAVPASAAEPGHPTVGAVQVLAHLKNYDLHGSHPEFDPYANPEVECAARDGDQIVVSANRILMWIDATTGAIVRKLPMLPLPGGDCKLAVFKRGGQTLLAYALADTGQSQPITRLGLVIMTRDGTFLVHSQWRQRRDWESYFIDMEIHDRTIYFNGSRDKPGPVRSFDLDSLTEGRSYDIPDYAGLYHDVTGVVALDQAGHAFRLPRDGSPIPVSRPGGSLTWAHCSDMREPMPVPVRGNFSVTIDHGKPGAPCESPEGINVRDANGQLVARRGVGREHVSRYMSMVIPWDDGLRIIAQDGRSIGFQVWKVPISF